MRKPVITIIQFYFLFGHLDNNGPVFNTPAYFVSLLKIELIHDRYWDGCP